MFQPHEVIRFGPFFCPTKDGASSIRAELKREEGRGGGKKVLLRVLTMRRGTFSFTRNLCDFLFLFCHFRWFFWGFSSDTRFSLNLRLLTVLLKNVAFLCVLVDANLGDWSVFGPKPWFFLKRGRYIGPFPLLFCDRWAYGLWAPPSDPPADVKNDSRIISFELFNVLFSGINFPSFFLFNKESLIFWLAHFSSFFVFPSFFEGFFYFLIGASFSHLFLVPVFSHSPFISA